MSKRATSRTQSPSQGTTIDATLQMILLTTALAGAITISAAAALSYSLRTRMVERVLSLSTGLLLGAALLYALPLAFEATADKRSLCATLLAGLLSFFVLEKYATLQRARRRPGQAPQRTGKAGWMILVGDGLHNFTDGILIAAAFLARPELGVLTALAIGAHTLAREVGDFIILLDAGYSRRRALVCNLLCSSLAAAGGLVGYLALARGMDAACAGAGGVRLPVHRAERPDAENPASGVGARHRRANAAAWGRRHAGAVPARPRIRVLKCTFAFL
ncbi:ZIP family metal transporter [Massilia eurypsychrophila]|uniref:ZIP family metal transporter n=1 Tax=Massilia eurypsychrophila TaxID=1485217 RepID=UPI0027D83DE6|nr:ZIP family metal transporter [Massilia eurypsychrophila]